MIKKNEFIWRLLDLIRKELEKNLLEEDILEDMIEKARNIIKNIL